MDNSVKYPRTAIVCNRKTSCHGENASDEEAEYDEPESIEAIRKVMADRGVDIVSLEADEHLPEKLREDGIEFVFNLAEGKGGRGREAQVPALLELMHIPYMGSDATAMSVSLDKDMCKRIAETYGVKTAKGVIIRPEDADIVKKTEKLVYPLIVKPNAEGSGRGIFENCIVKTPDELNTRLKEIFSEIKTDMIVEEFLSGREFTVGLIGNGAGLHAFSPMEIVYHQKTQDGYSVYSYKIKKNYKDYVEYKCPAELTAKEYEEITGAAKTVFAAIGCSDFARVDFRMNGRGEACFLEINPLPGLAPNYSDFPMTAESEGYSFDKLIFAIYLTALSRAYKK